MTVKTQVTSSLRYW